MFGAFSLIVSIQNMYLIFFYPRGGGRDFGSPGEAHEGKTFDHVFFHVWSIFFNNLNKKHVIFFFLPPVAEAEILGDPEKHMKTKHLIMFFF